MNSRWRRDRPVELGKTRSDMDRQTLGAFPRIVGVAADGYPPVF